MKTAILAAGVLAMAVCAPAAQAQDFEPLAKSCAENPDHDLAISACSQLLEDDSRITTRQRGGAYAARGMRYVLKGDYNRAAPDLDEAIRIIPEDAQFRNLRGIALAQTGELDRAKADFDEAIRRNPGFAAAYGNRGNLHVARGEADLAIKDCNASIKLDPALAESWNTCGLAYIQKGSWDLAIREFGEAIRINPEYSDAHKNRSFAYYAKGDAKRSIADSDRAITLNPMDPGSYANRGRTYLDLGEYDRAISDLTQAIQRPKAGRLPGQRALPGSTRVTLDQPMYYNASDPQVQIDPHFADAFRNRGIAYFHKGDFERSVADLDEAVRLDPTNDTAITWRDKAKKAKSGQK